MRTLSVVVIVIAAAGFYLSRFTDVPVSPDWELPAATEIPAGALTVRFSGTSTLLFSDGQTHWMTDGWFSRPGVVQIARDALAPDPEAIAYGLRRNEVSKLAAVIPLHSHYDHAMDAPLVAAQTGARVIGSAATANIARGLGLEESRIQVVSDREQVHLGAFSITFIESEHIPYPSEALVAALLTDSEIPAPLVPPAAITDYKLGKAYVLYVEHPLLNFMIIGSAGIAPGLLNEYSVPVLFQSIGGIGGQTEAYRDEFWQHTVDVVKPQTLVLMHWDSLLAPIDMPMVGEMRAATLLAGTADETRAFLNRKQDSNTDIAFATLPRFAPVIIHKGNN